MAERSSRSVHETRDKEAWLVHLLEGDPEGQKELGPLLATASLARAAAEQMEEPPGAEEASRQRALAEFAAWREQQQPAPATPPRASWFIRFGSAMRFVFTLGRRR